MKNYTILENNLKDETANYIKNITLGLGKVDTHFITDMFVGMLKHNSVILSDIVRQTGNINIKKGVERLERNLDSFDNIENVLMSNYIQMVKPYIDDSFNKPVEKLLFSITGFEPKEDNSYGIYNDAYWCGQNYFDLHIKTKKSFVYLFLKLPFEEMMNIYSIFHEMDFSSLVDYFHKKENEKTILRILCEEKRCSLNDLCKATSLSLNTLRKYNSSDDILYNASFQNIVKLIQYFNISYLLFVR